MSKAWFRLAVVDAVATVGGFARLHRFIRRLAPRGRRQTRTVEEIRATIDRAAVYYPRQLYCLRRSAANRFGGFERSAPSNGNGCVPVAHIRRSALYQKLIGFGGI